MSQPEFEQWRLDDVIRITGMCKTDVYRRMKDTDPQLNPFPRSYPYAHSKSKRFWRSDEIRTWQRREVGIDPLTIEEMVG